eukprot:5320329-Amphidinium_carterae.2
MRPVWESRMTPEGPKTTCGSYVVNGAHGGANGSSEGTLHGTIAIEMDKVASVERQQGACRHPVVQ